MKYLKIFLLTALLIPSSSFAQNIKHEFKSPSFSGIGASSHYLTIENQQFTRQKDIEKKHEDKLRAELAAIENSTLNRFLRNVESRIYSELSRQLVTNLFSNGFYGVGEIEMQGYMIRYEQDVDQDGLDVLRLTITSITDPSDVTIITIPIGAFGGFGG
jgi:hypothetical protein